MADQPGIAEQRLHCLVRHRAHAARLETAEDLFESWPFGVDEAVLQTGPENPERHLRQITVVRHRLQFGGRAWLRQSYLERRRSETGPRGVKDRGKGRRRHRSLSTITACEPRRKCLWSRRRQCCAIVSM